MNTPGGPTSARARFVNPITGQPMVGDRGALAEAVAAAVRSIPGVEGLHTGRFGEVATYLPGRRVEGVQVRDNSCAIHVVLAWGAPVLATADRVRAVVAPLVGRPVDITVEDVVDPSLSPPGSGG